MTKRLLLLFAVLALFAPSAFAGSTAAPQRIVSIVPAVTQMLFAASAFGVHLVHILRP